MATDVLVVGGGVSGVLSAHCLNEKGYSVGLAEAQEKLGGRCRVDHFHGVSVDYGLHFNVVGPEPLYSLNLMTTSLDIHAAPLILDKTGWIPAALDALSLEQKLFFFQDFTLIQGGMEKLIQVLSQNLHIEYSQMVQSIEIEDSKIKKIQSAQKSWEPKVVLFALPFNELGRIIPATYIHPKILKALKRQSWVSAVKLDFILKRKIYDGQSVLFVPEGLGFFPSNSDPTLSDGDYQLSQWLFFISSETLQDPEEIAKKIRAGKRWIRKAFPDLFDQVHWEKIGVIDRLFPKDPLPSDLKKEWCSLKNVFWVGDAEGGPNPTGNGLIPVTMKEVQRIEDYLSLG